MLGVQRPRLRRICPKRWLRSDVYWKVVAFERRHEIQARLDRVRGGPGRETVIQDIEVPIERAAEFLDVFHREIGMTPVWMCPLRLRERDRDVDAVPARSGHHLRQLRLLGRGRAPARGAARATATA